MKKALVLLLFTCFAANAFVSEEHDSQEFSFEPMERPFGYDKNLSYRTNSLSSITSMNSSFSSRSSSDIDDAQQPSIRHTNWRLADDGVVIAVSEVFAGLLSWGAAYEPKTLGWVYVGVSPMVFDGGARPALFVTSASLAGLGAYNLTVDKDKTSKHEIFLTNMLALNFIALAVTTTDYIAPYVSEHVVVYPDMSGNWFINYHHNF